MKKTLWTALLVATLGACTASASLIMKIDTSSKTFYFEGSDTGSNVDQWDSGTYDLTFYTTDTYAFTSGASLDMDSCLEETFLYVTRLECSLGVKSEIMLMGPDHVTSLTGTGSSGAVSYATLSSADQTVFESMVGDAFSLSAGTGFSSISIAAVPEPATAGLLGISVGALWLFRRLKKAANYYRS